MHSRNRSLVTGALAGALIVWGLYAFAPTPRVAEAQVPDAGAQRAEMIAQMRAMNDKLSGIATILADIRDGKVTKKDDAPKKP